jgi:hypothetical protein
MKKVAHVDANILWRNAESSIPPVQSANSAPQKSWLRAWVLPLPRPAQMLALLKLPRLLPSLSRWPSPRKLFL